MMATPDRSTARVVMLGALLVVGAVALRGALPDGERHPSQERALSGPAALALIVALLGVSLAIIAVAVLARMRDPRASAPSTGRSDWSRDGTARPRWRTLLAIVCVAVAALGVVLLLSRLGLPGLREPPAHGPAPEAVPTSAPPSGPTGPVPAPDNRSPAGENILRMLYATAIGFLLLVAASSIVAARRSRHPIPVPQSSGRGQEANASGHAGQSLARAAELGLAEVGDPNREPRAAIIACYAAMERELARLPAAAPRDFDTASEVLARAVEHEAIRSGSATQLVELFEEARFSPHVMGESHRDSAVQALQLVLAELRVGA